MTLFVLLQHSRKLIWFSFGEDEMLQNLKQALPILWLPHSKALPWMMAGSLEMLACCLSVQLWHTGEMGEWRADWPGSEFELQTVIHCKLPITCFRVISPHQRIQNTEIKSKHPSWLLVSSPKNDLVWNQCDKQLQFFAVHVRRMCICSMSQQRNRTSYLFSSFHHLFLSHASSCNLRDGYKPHLSPQVSDVIGYRLHLPPPPPPPPHPPIPSPQNTHTHSPQQPCVHFSLGWLPGGNRLGLRAFFLEVCYCQAKARPI